MFAAFCGSSHRPRHAPYLDERRRVILGVVEPHNVRRAERLEHLAVVRGREPRQRLIVRRTAASGGGGGRWRVRQGVGE